MVTEEIVKKFGNIDGIGQKLQQKLEERKKTTENWVSFSYCFFVILNSLK